MLSLYMISVRSCRHLLPRGYEPCGTTLWLCVLLGPQIFPPFWRAVCKCRYTFKYWIWDLNVYVASNFPFVARFVRGLVLLIAVRRGAPKLVCVRFRMYDAYVLIWESRISNFKQACRNCFQLSRCGGHVNFVLRAELASRVLTFRMMMDL